MKLLAMDPSHRREWRSNLPTLGALAAILVLSLVLPAPQVSRGLAHYLPLHTLLEVLGIIVAAMVFAIGWSTQKYRRDGSTLWLSCLFLGVALLDLSHTLSYQGMPDYITPSDPEKAINFWLAARTVAAAALLGAAGLAWRGTSIGKPQVTLWVVLLAVGAAHLVLLGFSDSVPHTFIAGQGLTAYKIAFEYGLIAAYLLAALVFLASLRRPRTYNASGFFAVAAIMAMSEYFFTVYANVTDLYNLLGHVYKVAAYGVLYNALFVEAVSDPYRRLSLSQRHLEATINALPDALFEVDGDGNLLAVYAQRPDMLVVPPARMRGLNLRELPVPEASIRACLDAMVEASLYGVSRGTSIQVLLLGRSRHFELSISHVRAGEQDGETFLVLAHDQTELVAQRAALEHEAQLNGALLALARLASECDEDTLLRQGATFARELTASAGAAVQPAVEGRNPTVATGVAGIQPLALDALMTCARRPEPLMLNNSVDIAPLLAPSLALPARMLSVAVVEAGQTRLVLAAFDKGEDYRDQDLKTLQILADTLWQQVSRHRQERTISLLSSALDQSPNSVLITDVAGHIEYVNRAFETITGYGAEEVVGRSPGLLKSDKTPRSLFEEMWSRLRQGESWQGELVNRRKDGGEVQQRVLIYPLRNRTGRVVNYIAHEEDITAEKESEARIQRLANYDQLTDLPNSQMLGERFGHALDIVRRHHEPLALLSLDVDNFQGVNDSFGHSVGDLLLKEVALRIRPLLKDQDILSRYSGDNFVLVLPGASQEMAALTASVLLAELDRPIPLQGRELGITASIGIALFPSDGDTLEALLMCADVALHQVKRSGRNHYRFFAPAMQQQASRSLAVISAMKQALSRNEMFLVYQPQFTLDDGRLVGAEVLLRWHSVELGAVSPAEFIPLAESYNLIQPIGEWVLRTAAAQLRRWHQQSMADLVLAVNLSAVQFAQPDLAGLLCRILAEEGVSPHFIELELTEAVALKDPEWASETIAALKQAGFHLAIDDFGTGYSSLSYLKRFAVDKLKVDQSFVRDIEDDPDDRAIVTAITQMAKGLGIATIAEGVERAGQLAVLRAVGCDEGQGYLFCHPLPAEQFEAFVAGSGLTV